MTVFFCRYVSDNNYVPTSITLAQFEVDGYSARDIIAPFIYKGTGDYAPFHFGGQNDGVILSQDGLTGFEVIIQNCVVPPIAPTGQATPPQPPDPTTQIAPASTPPNPTPAPVPSPSTGVPDSNS